MKIGIYSFLLAVSIGIFIIDREGIEHQNEYKYSFYVKDLYEYSLQVVKPAIIVVLIAILLVTLYQLYRKYRR